jgi:cytochrome c-type biogenesis protein
MARWHNRLLSAGQVTKVGLGIVFVAIGALVLSGLDKSVEAALVATSPQRLTDLTTRF